MHIEIAKDSFLMFINSSYIVNWDKDNLISKVKEIINKRRYELKLRGFYKIKVYVNKKVGLFIEGVKLDDLDYGNILDLRIILLFDEKVYFETEDYFIIDNVLNIRYYNNKYYCLVDDINIMDVCEFGRFIYGEDVLRMMNNSYLITKKES